MITNNANGHSQINWWWELRNEEDASGAGTPVAMRGEDEEVEGGNGIDDGEATSETFSWLSRHLRSNQINIIWLLWLCRIHPKSIIPTLRLRRYPRPERSVISTIASEVENSWDSMNNHGRSFVHVRMRDGVPIDGEIPNTVACNCDKLAEQEGGDLCTLHEITLEFTAREGMRENVVWNEPRIRGPFFGYKGRVLFSWKEDGNRGGKGIIDMNAFHNII